MKRSEGGSVHKETQVDQDHLKIVQFYREKMNLQPLHSALRSFNVQDGARMSGVYEICRNNEVNLFYQVVIVGQRDCMGLRSQGAGRIFDRSKIPAFRCSVHTRTKLTRTKIFYRLDVQKLER